MSAFKEGDPTTLNRLYGRSQGKPLRASQQELVDKLLPQIAVPAEGTVTAERLFGFDRPLHFEIGFGGGEGPAISRYERGNSALPRRHAAANGGPLRKLAAKRGRVLRAHVRRRDQAGPYTAV